jgi:hypothetical protein
MRILTNQTFLTFEETKAIYKDVGVLNFLIQFITAVQKFTQTLAVLSTYGLSTRRVTPFSKTLRLRDRFCCEL